MSRHDGPTHLQSRAIVVHCPGGLSTPLSQLRARRHAEHFRHGLALTHRATAWGALHHALPAPLALGRFSLH